MGSKVGGSCHGLKLSTAVTYARSKRRLKGPCVTFKHPRMLARSRFSFFRYLQTVGVLRLMLLACFPPFLSCDESNVFPLFKKSPTPSSPTLQRTAYLDPHNQGTTRLSSLTSPTRPRFLSSSAGRKTPSATSTSGRSTFPFASFRTERRCKRPNARPQHVFFVR